MKLAISAALLSSTAAFAPAARHASLMRRMVVSDPSTVEEAPVETAAPPAVEIESETVVAKETKAEVKEEEPFFVDPEPSVGLQDQIEPGRYDILKNSITLPFLSRPTYLDGSHAGDFGFDPLGLGEDDLYFMQECELRHARLAMLAVAGWPLSELIAPGFMLQDGKAPSVLNGFNPISGGAVGAFFIAMAVFEWSTALRFKSGTKLGEMHQYDMKPVWKNGVAGDYNFDPLGFYNFCGDDARGRKAIREVEVTQGRYAMLAISFFAFYESLTGKPIVEDNIFFHPNPVLPLLGVGYFAWSQFYQISDLREYPIKIEYTKDGEEMLRGVKRALMGPSK